MFPHRTSLIFPIILLLLAFTLGCSLLASPGADQEPQVTEEPTLHPTFTPTPIQPTPTPLPQTPTPEVPTPVPPVVESTTAPSVGESSPTAPPPVVESTTEPPAEPTPEPPTPTEAPQPAQVLVVAPAVNLRSGPGTNYPRVAQATQGQTFAISGRNNQSSWYQINRSSGPAWVINDNRYIQASGELESVVVVQDIPAPPQPTRARPTQPPAPTATPVPSYAFQAGGAIGAATSNPWLNVFGAVQDQSGAWLQGYQIKALRSGGDAGVSEVSRPGYSDATCPDCGDNQRQNLKYEFPDQGAAEWEVWLIDGAGNQVSNSVKFTTNPGTLQWFFVRFTRR